MLERYTNRVLSLIVADVGTTREKYYDFYCVKILENTDCVILWNSLSIFCLLAVLNQHRRPINIFLLYGHHTNFSICPKILASITIIIFCRNNILWITGPFFASILYCPLSLYTM